MRARDDVGLLARCAAYHEPRAGAGRRGGLVPPPGLARAARARSQPEHNHERRAPPVYRRAAQTDVCFSRASVFVVRREASRCGKVRARRAPPAPSMSSGAAPSPLRYILEVAAHAQA